MKYSNYTEEIMSDKKYRQICNMFFELAPNDKIKSILQSILYEGGYKDYNINTEIVNKINPYVEIQRRIDMAYLLITNPKTFQIFFEQKITLFHGTNGNALPNILKYGLNSLKESEKAGIEVVTGEVWSRTNTPRDFISFTDILGIAHEYSKIKGNNEEEKLSFEVIICTTVDNIQKHKTFKPHSDIVETGVISHIPLNDIKAILVQKNKIAFVKKLVNNSEIKILPLDYFDKKFYYIDDFLYSIETSHEKFEELKTILKQPIKRIFFSLKEIENITKKLQISKIKQTLYNFYLSIIERNKSQYGNRKSK